MSPEACRAARDLLGWSMQRLADESKVHKDTILRFEKGRARNVQERTLLSLRRTFEDAGVEFAAGESKAEHSREVHLCDGMVVRLAKPRLT